MIWSGGVSIPYRYGITFKRNIKVRRSSYVSIPYRYGITYTVEDLNGNFHILLFQFLIGTVLQQYFRRFLALSSFFSSNLIKKSVDLTFYYRKFP